MDQFIGEPEYWNMGIGAEYCRVVCQYLRTEMDADAVILDPRKIIYEQYEHIRRQDLKLLRNFPNMSYTRGKGRLCADGMESVMLKDSRLCRVKFSVP